MISKSNRFTTVLGGRRQCRPAFTLIELLTVIGIMTVLAAISVIAFQHVALTAKGRDTREALETARAMWAEANASGGAIMVGNILPATSVAAPGLVTVGQIGRDPTQDPALMLTGQVMYYLLTSPKNQNIMNNLPAQRKLTIMVTVGGVSKATLVLLDGFGNPILFIPPLGMTGVNAGTQTGLTIQSNPAAPQSFWASAGIDGSFTAGDDNLYSFSR